MTYLSRITLNPNDKAARTDMGSPYQLHATLSRLARRSERLLWRHEIHDGDAPAHVLIQTSAPPNWSYVKKTDSYLLEAVTRENKLLRNLQAGDRLRFQLRANPTFMDSKTKKRHPYAPTKGTNSEWLANRLNNAGARTTAQEILETQNHRTHTRKHGDGYDRIKLHTVDFTGLLTITDPHAFRKLIQQGIGPAKSFGHGLMLIART